MSNIYVPGQKEIYMISYLTMNGWRPETLLWGPAEINDPIWVKEGFSQEIRGVFSERFSESDRTEKFSLIEAFEAQQNTEDETKIS